MEKPSEQPGSESAPRTCPQCGAELPVGVPVELCPKCLLAAAMSSKTELPGDTVKMPSGGEGVRSLIASGETFGHYRIIRSIGGGGMGAVYEAEDLETSRRVALKVLSHKLDSPEARERFFREGRLAASINHQNSVYIYGTEEIGGTPVISMELLAGGTLQDVVQKRGAMNPGAAVDAILQIIEGLEAAQRAGILHRDVKPSNCFVDAYGAVKIGDFGLSISTAVRTEPALTVDGAFLGTPAFCPPEQLRGEELNARSDIYSVGATLYYLLTGKTPFEAQNMVALIATVLEKPVPSLLQARPEISTGLASVVQKCLQKVRGDRYANYAELRKALEPFSSAAPVAAPLGIRFLAGFVDFIVLSSVVQIVVLAAMGGMVNFLNVLSRPSPGTYLLMFGAFGFNILYYTFFEGRFGAGVGKALCRLRVTGPNRDVPGIWRAGLRASIYVILPTLPFWISSVAMYSGGIRDFLKSPQAAVYPSNYYGGFFLLALTPYVVMALFFLTARRRNGLRAVHDLATNTQVIVRQTVADRGEPMQAREPVGNLQKAGELGPYKILERFAEENECRWLVGYDLRLLRKVWIREVPAGTEPYPVVLRNLSRPGRLRWLTGKRSKDENWDAFEVPGGQSFWVIAKKPQQWKSVRFWLWDLAQELATAQRDNTLPQVLTVDRVWITDEGKPKILDVPAPGTPSRQDPSSKPAESLLPEEFLARVAVAALKGDPEAVNDSIPLPIPQHAREFVSELRTSGDMNSIILRLGTLLRRNAAVTHLRRTAVVLGCLAFPLFILGSAVFGRIFLDEFEKQQPELIELNQVLAMRSSTRFMSRAQRPSEENFSVMIASRYRQFITNETKWNSPLAKIMIAGEKRSFAEMSVAKYPDPTPEQVAAALKKVPVTSMGSVTKELGTYRFFMIMLYGTFLMYVCVPAVISSLCFRGGLVLLISRIVFVRRDGLRASRLRMFWRSIVTWAPLWLCMFTGASSFVTRNAWVGVVGLAVMLVLTVISLSLPERGLQDRLAGTWPVPK